VKPTLQFRSFRRGFLATTALNGASQVLGIVVVAALAYFFGAGSQTDVYVYALSCQVVTTGLVGALNAAVVIPESMQLRAQVSPVAAIEFLNVFMWLYASVGLLLTLFIWIEPVRIFLALSRFDASVLTAHREMLRSLALFFLLDLLCSHLGEILASLRFFTLTALASLLNKVCSLAGLLLFHRQLGVGSIVAGSVVAYVLQLGFLLWLLRRHFNWHFRPRWAAVSASSRKNLAYAMSGQVVSSVATLVAAYLISSFDSGTLTALNFAQRIVSAPQMLLMNQFSLMAGLKLNELQSRRDHDGVNAMFLRSNRSLLLAMTTLTALLILNAELVVALLFRRGAFDSAAAARSAVLLRLLALALPLFGINTLVARLFMSAQKTQQAFWFQVSMGLLHVALTVLCIRALGVAGYPMATFLMYACTLLLLLPLMRRVFPAVAYPSVMRSALAIWAMVAPLAGVTWLIARLSAPVWHPAVMLALSAIFGLAVLGLNQRFRWSTDVIDLIRSTRRRPFARTESA
jgi:putative peptidoglycan lipid II flippase